MRKTIYELWVPVWFFNPKSPPLPGLVQRSSITAKISKLWQITTFALNTVSYSAVSGSVIPILIKK